jgi:adenine-specific DNA-methyltransferase
MAKIEDLITEIADARLRGEIAREVAALKRQKKFGLVFEEHIPEQLTLPGLPVKPGLRVVKRNRDTRAVFLVENVDDNSCATIRTENGVGTTETVSTTDLVVIKRFGEPIYPTLTPVASLTRSPGRPYHAIVNADNFHALQLFLYCYAGQVDVIYIDPPYNKGARDWKYNNDYVDASDQWRHSKWLAMMKRRILLAKRLLRPDGVLVVTIDENEVHHLGMLLADIFPESDHHMLTTVINPKGTGKLNFARMDEYAMFCVPRTGTNLISANHVPFLSQIHEQSEEAPEEDDDPAPPEQQELLDVVGADLPFPPEDRDDWELRHARRRGNESSYRHQRPNQFYAIFIDPDAKRVVRVGDSLPADAEPSMADVDGLAPVWPIDEDGNHRCWRFIPETMRTLVADRRLVLGRLNKVRRTWTLNYWVRKSTNKKVKTVWWSSRHDAGTHGTTLLHKILGRRDAFPFPKSLYVVRDTLSTICGNRPNALILDFFAGSGTTYHATALLNAGDHGNRRCLLVTNNEVTEKLARELNAGGLFPGDADFEKHGICEAVTWPRCKYVTQGHRDDGSPLSGSYLDGGLMQDGFQENIEYFRLDFLDPHEVAYGARFEAIVPVLWLMAGAKGERETVRGRGKWFIPEDSPYAVLIQEQHFADFRRELAARPDVALVFLVTDSAEAFREMSAALPSQPQTKMLYKSYLDNFRINLETSL